MKKLGDKLRDTALACVFIVFISAVSQFKEGTGYDGVGEEVQTALSDLKESDIEIKATGQSLEILPISHIIYEPEILRSLNRAYGKNNVLMYSIGHVGVYTMSAQSPDRSHHLVNAYLEGYQPFEVDNVMMPLYVLAKRKSYLLDHKQYPGRPEVWQSSRQAFLYTRGDCEDHAIALADWLIEMNQDARVVLGEADGGGHAWVVLFKDGKEYLLEATQKNGVSRSRPYPIAALFKNYHPKYMFNRDGFWVNEGTKYTTDYSGEHWAMRSLYDRDGLSGTNPHGLSSYEDDS